MNDNDASGCWGVLALGFIAWSLWPGSGDHWNDILWWSAKYGLSYGGVHMSTKPADCNFLQAPLGIKGCSFQPRVTAYNEAGVIVGGDNAPKYGHDTKTGKPIISYDNGQTWEWYPASAAPDLKIKSVEIQWIKVAD